ncbi:hypothetical protein ACQ4PT_067606 [Festuca glaucescens]
MGDENKMFMITGRSEYVHNSEEDDAQRDNDTCGNMFEPEENSDANGDSAYKYKDTWVNPGQSDQISEKSSCDEQECSQPDNHDNTNDQNVGSADDLAADASECEVRFQKQLKFTAYLHVQEVEPNKKYEVYKSGLAATRDYRTRRYLVIVDLTSDDFKCICSKFNKDGILCSHVLKVLVHLNIVHIPDKYFIARWMPREKKDIRDLRYNVPLEMTGECSQMRFNVLSKVCINVASDGSKSNEKYLFVTQEVKKIAEKLDAMTLAEDKAKEVDPKEKSKEQVVDVQTEYGYLNDPKVVKSKGRPTILGKNKLDRRYMTFAEQFLGKQQITCSHCGSHYHNIQTCESLHLDESLFANNKKAKNNPRANDTHAVARIKSSPLKGLNKLTQSHSPPPNRDPLRTSARVRTGPAMEVFYYLVFGGLAAVVAALELGKSGKDRVATPTAFNSFKNNYVLVYSLMMSGDWLQGPYVYYLYSQYGFDKGDIGRLFIAGFGSSMLFGTIVGSLADKQGRKRACITYCITYILSCITKHSPQYRILMIGRVLGGIATSLLFSAFESWLVAEHNKRGFDPQWLSITFSKAIFLGNGLVAIVAGLFANLLADNLGFGPVAPFDAAACFLAIGMAIILSSWGENYGDASEGKDLMAQFKVAAKAIASDEKIALLGAIQSLFEGSMYTFVFLWTPALSPNDEEIPHGFIFATFMLSSMLGSSIASRLLARKMKVEGYMQIVFSISAFTLFLPVVTNFIVPPSEKGSSISFGGCLQLLGFCIFESCVGIFWPSIMKMRSQYIPEEVRSTIMNFFRIPLNLFVCVVLYNVNAFPITVMFGMCSIFLFIAAILQRRLMVVSDLHRSISTKATEMTAEDEPLNP